MATKKFVTCRSVDEKQRMGQLLLPLPKEGDKDTLKIDGFCIHACFGNIFKPIVEYMEGRPDQEWVPVMSNFPTGTVLGRWLQGGGHYPNGGADLVSLKDGAICLVGRAEGDPPVADAVDPSIKYAIGYRYNKSDIDISDDMELIAQAAPEGSLLVIPAIGTNNGVSFAESACRLFYAVITSLDLEGSAVKGNLSGILFISPLDGAGARMISHMINLFNIFRETLNEPVCPICRNLRQDTVLSCGHRFCGRCILALPEQAPCPQCRATIRHMSPCYKIVDCKDFRCCGVDQTDKPSTELATAAIEATAPSAAGGVVGADASETVEDPDPESEKKEKPRAVEKMPFIYVPCGHMNSLCFKCSGGEITARKTGASKTCRVCGEPVMAYLRIYS